jgi:hypothetical protein
MSKKISPIPLEKLPAVTAEAEVKKVPGLEDHDLRFLAIEGALAESKISMAESKISIAEYKNLHEGYQ